MADINFQAVRAFERIMRPIHHLRAEVEYADSLFDGGEFSASFHDRESEAIEDRVVALVATRFGISANQLDSDIQARNWHEVYMLTSPKQRRAA
jgi:hypothetical protein